jgi:hypothetical protein
VEVVGVRAVIDGLQQYIGGARQIEKSTGEMGRAVDDVASKSGKLGAFGSALGGVAKIAGGFIVAQGLLKAPGMLVAAANAAAEDAASTAKLQRAVENTGAAYGKYAGQIKTTIDLAQKRGFTDDQARDSLSILTAQTDDAGEALRRFGLAQDLARGANIDVVTASRLLGKVTDENVNVLNRYGISVEKGASETELFAAVQRKFGGQADDFAKSAAGQAAAAKIAFSEFKESIGYLVLPVMGALAKLMNTTVIPALNKLVQLLGPILQAQTRRLATAFRGSAIIPFAKDLGAALQSLAKYVRFVTQEGDLLNDFLADLPTKARPVAVGLGIIVLVAQEVARQLVTIARYGDDVLRFLGNMASRLERVTPGGREFADQLARIGGQETTIRRIAAAITALIAALVAKAVVDFAVGLATMAFQFATFPIRAALEAAGAVKDFASAAAGLVSKVVSVTVNAVGTALDFVRSLVGGTLQRLIDATPGLRVKVEPTVTVPPTGAVVKAGGEAGQGFLSGFTKTLANFGGAAIAGTLGTIFGNIIANPNIEFRTVVLGYLTAIAAAFRILGGRVLASSVAVALGQAFVAAGPLTRASVVGALVQLVVSSVEIAFDLVKQDFRKAGVRAGFSVAGGIIGGIIAAIPSLGIATPLGVVIGAGIGAALGDLFLLFESQITSFVRSVPSLLAALPGIFGEVLGRAAATAIALPILIAAFIIRGLARMVPRLVSALVSVGADIVSALADAVVAAAPLVLTAFSYVLDPRRAILALVDFLMEQIALTIRDPRRLLRAAQDLASALAVGFRAVAGLSVEAFDVGLGFLTGVVDRVFSALEGALGEFAGRFVQGFRDQWNEIDRISDGGLSQIVSAISSAIGAVLAMPATLAAAAGSFFSAALDLGEAIFGGLMSGLRQTPGMIGAFIDGIKEAVKTAINAAIDAINDAIPDSIPLKIRGIGIDVPIPDNPLPHVALAKGTASFAGGLALLGEHGREFAFLPRGTAVAPANQTNAILRAVASLIPGSSRAAGSTIGISMPVSVYVQEFDWSEVRRAIHREVDSSFTASRSRSTRAGAAIGSGIG